eukprot:CAMPEP_0184552444 /NCGR_PEP_ID=MMETSP0199_2-20130426/29025_1 /TAXON_ID=1112570 /ORGANISM="Thraustochytrium sp., Strain LLF1b" /LENGTH=343 /DNA_ID=CAMNT_0026947939 /DNA_START=1 /DNA_END=1032 /DNA_ORIENTATION=+
MSGDKIRVGVNGFGRIGRLATRVILANEESNLEIVHINELNSDGEGCAYLLEFDSIHGKFPGEYAADEGSLTYNGHKIKVTRGANPGNVAWEESNVDLVLECSGKFNDEEKLEVYYTKGIKRVCVSAPVKGPNALNIVMGCNDDLLTPEKKLVTATSCTTNCIGPVIKALDNAFGIERGCINTVHNITQTQSLMDAPNTKKSDPRRARAGMLNLAPTSTGSATAVTLIFPHLKGKLNGVAIRVPLQNASITDLTLELKQDVTKEQVNEALTQAADNKILGVETRGLVSTDYINDSRSSIVDAASTMVIDNRMVKVLAWYDNEWGYSCRLADIAEIMAKQMLQA